MKSRCRVAHADARTLAVCGQLAVFYKTGPSVTFGEPELLSNALMNYFTSIYLNNWHEI
jgi:hypothetical protein